MVGYGIEWKILGCSRELWERNEDCGRKWSIRGKESMVGEIRYCGREKKLALWAPFLL